MSTVLFFLIKDNSFLKRKEKQAKKTNYFCVYEEEEREERRGRGEGEGERKSAPDP